MKPKTLSSLSEDGEGDEPPDRLTTKNRINHQGLKRQTGSFLIDKNNLQFLKPLSVSNLKTISPQSHSKNRYSPVFKGLRIEIVSDIEGCFNLWNEFSPKKSLFDTWEFRFAFYLGYKHKPYFILLKNLNENIGLLPLWYERDERKYFWFGSSWQEENTFFVKKPLLVPLLLNICPAPVLLNAIKVSNISAMKEFVDLKFDDSKYILNLSDIKTSEDFLMKLKKNRRRDLRKDRGRIERQNPKIIINNFSNFDDLIRLSKERFKQKGEETDWEDPQRVETFRQVIKLAGRSYKIRMVTICIGEKIAGVDLIALFNNCYYALKCGYDVKNFSGIGNFINLIEIEDALKLGMRKFDLLQNNYEWKNRWFEEVPLLKYEK